MTGSCEIEVFFDECAPPISCVTVEELDRVLDQLEARADPTRPPLAVAIVAYEHEVDLGLGTDPTFLCIQVPPRDGECYVAVGDLTAGEARAFYGAGQDSYWAPKHLVPAAAARDAVRHFILCQARSKLLRWESWDGRAA